MKFFSASKKACFPGVEKQLGLKLQKIKAQLDVIVIDQIERVPIEN
jgi:uncharacterized protein (TIGR03435 family)